MSDPQYEKFMLTASIASWSVLFIALIVCLTWYTSKGSGYISNNQESQDKITAIDEAMSSALGPKWPFVLLTIVIFIAITLGAVYLAMQNNQINITVEDQTADKISWIFIIFSVIFSIFVILLGIKQWLNYRQQQDNGDDPNYQPGINQQKQNNLILLYTGIGLAVLAVAGYFGWKYYQSRMDKKV